VRPAVPADEEATELRWRARPSQAVAPEGEPAGPALEYARRLYANVLDWYKLADTKAQLLLTIDGAFITIIAGAVFGNPEELSDRVRRFGPETWVLLAVSALALLLSVGCAALCLWSRTGLGERSIRRLMRRELGVDPERRSSYTPRVAWWFGMIAMLEPRHIAETIKGADAQFERDALVSQIVVLSRNVLKKHLWVNRGWALAAASAGSLVALTATYVVRVAG
jgi:hypothetical protein